MTFSQKIIVNDSYTEKNNYFLLYELIQDLPYDPVHENFVLIAFMVSIKA